MKINQIATAEAGHLGSGNGWRALALGMMFLCVTPVLAKDVSGSVESSWLLNKKDIHANVHFQVGSLVGEPIVNAQIDWRPTNLSKHIPSIYTNADPSLTRPTHYGNVSEAESKLRLYDTKVSLEVRYGGDVYYIRTDAGVPAKPGKERSYNVPGSPGWDSLLTTPGGLPVKAEVAKQIMRDGLNVTGAGVTNFKVDTSQFERWWFEKNVDRYTKPLKDTIDRKLDALSFAFGLPVDDLRKEVAALRSSGRPGEDIAKLQGILDKLSPSNLPKKYLGEGAERLTRLWRYTHLAQDADDIFRRESDGLPPMPGSSRMYDTWYKEMEVRLARNSLKMVQLEGRKHAIEVAEQRAREAEQRERERREQIAREEREARERQVREAREKRERARQREARRRAREEQRQQVSQGENFDFWGALAEGLRSSGWQSNPYEPNWARDGWMYRPDTPSDKYYDRKPREMNCRDNDSCSTFRYGLDKYGKPVR